MVDSGGVESKPHAIAAFDEDFAFEIQIHYSFDILLTSPLWYFAGNMKLKTAAFAAAAALCATGSHALEPTKIKAELCEATGTTSWQVSAPSTTDPSPPRLDVDLSTDDYAGNLTAPHWQVSGSLGIPDHPLGVFAFEGNGTACGEQTTYVKDGVLGQVVVTFPPCPWQASADGATAPVNVTVHVDVWTVLPAIPPLLSTGFELDLSVGDGAADGDQELCLKVDLAQPPATGAEKSQDVCNMNDPEKSTIPPYPPTDPNAQIPSVTVDLDAPAGERWSKIVEPRKAAIEDLINTFTDMIMKKNGTAHKLVELLLDGAAIAEMKRMPPAFREEIEGIALSTGIGVGSLWVLNMMYEITGACTSFILQDSNDQIWHGRNLDFGLFMGTDPDNHTWLLTEKLRAVLMNVEFVRDGKPLYNATTYAGFVGLLSGSRPDAFSITVNTRYDDTFLVSSGYHVRSRSP